MELTIKPTNKQNLAWAILKDTETTDFLFGGGAGGGKTWLGCEWLITMCIMYPGTRYFIARETLKNLKKTTLRTFFKVARFHGLKLGVHYFYNEQSSTITFPHIDTKGIHDDGIIDLLEVKFKPSDPDYEDLGSSEYTAGWIEEAGEVNFGAYDTLKTRVGRQKNGEFELLGKIYITCNPKKNWLYTTFYKPWREKQLPIGYRFIQSLVDDNPKNEPGYRAKLENLKDKVKKQRLLYGKWEYDDSAGALMRYDSITDIFSNTVKNSEDKYISVDAARLGGDRIVMYVWKGFKIYKVFIYVRQSTAVTENRIRELSQVEQVPYSQIVVDEDGVGGGIVDHLSGIKGFVNNSRPLVDQRTQINDLAPNYGNLKTQCYYILADEINNHNIAIHLERFESEDPEVNEEQFKDELIEELEQVKSRDPDNDEKRLFLVPKEDVKELLGRSPDLSDAMMMRMVFSLGLQSLPESEQNENEFKIYAQDFT